jgi:hypothetical protein
MVGMDTMAIGGSDIAKDLLRVRRILFLWRKKIYLKIYCLANGRNK